MSPQDLLHSGVIGLEDEISSLPISPCSELPSSDSETETSEICVSRGSVTESLSCIDGLVQQKVDKTSILQDLEVLEEQILEETLKLEALHVSEAGELLSESVPCITTQSSCRERRMILPHLEKEKRDVEKMERSQRRERMRKRSGHKIVRCSIMERNLLKDLSGSDMEENLSYKNTSHCTEMSTRRTPQNVFSSETLGKEVTKSEPSLSSSASPDSTSRSDRDVLSCRDESDLSQSSGTDLPASVQPEVNEISSCDRHGVDTAVDQMKCSASTLDSSSTQKTNPENGAFDPGGAVTPVPAPRTMFCCDTQTQRLSELITESVPSGDFIQTPGEFTNSQVRRVQGFHMHNNNNNTLIKPYLHDGHSETQQNTFIPNTDTQPDHEESVPISSCERNDRGVYNSGAVFISLLDQPQLNMSNRPVHTRYSYYKNIQSSMFEDHKTMF